MKIRPLILTVIFLFISCGPLTAATITSPYGDQDGFGIGAKAGENFLWSDIQGSSGIYSQFPTDKWSNRSILELGWTHSYSLAGFGQPTSACLEIFTGGQGDFGLSQMYLDDQFIGYISSDGGNFARRHTLDLSTFLDYLDGSNTFTFTLKTALSTNNDADNWVLDYSLLTISDTDDVSCVPLPSSLLLLAGGCLGLWGCRKKVKRKN